MIIMINCSKLTNRRSFLGLNYERMSALASNLKLLFSRMKVRLSLSSIMSISRADEIVAWMNLFL